MALMKVNRAIAVTLLTIVGEPAIHAGSLIKIWELDLRKIVRGAPSASAENLPVQLIRFSPDGQQLAVAVAWDLSPDVFKSQLLLLGAQRPERLPRQIETGAGIGNEGMARPFGWSPDGGTLFLAGKVIDLKLGTSCELPRASSPPYWPSFLMSGDRLIQGGPELPDANAVRARMDTLREMLKNNKGPISSSRLPPGPGEPGSRFTFFNLECARQEEWKVPEAWEIHDVALEGHVVAITREVGFHAYEFLIVDPFARKVIRRWQSDYPNIGSFAEGGNVLCNVVEEGRKAPLVCRQADNGKEIGKSESINGGFPIATAERSSRVIASDYHAEKDPRSTYETDWVLDRRVVWDYRSGREIAAWLPEWQSNAGARNEQMKVPYQFAISPDGQYAADGGNGIIRLFKIEP